MKSITENQLQLAANVSRETARIWHEPMNVAAAEAAINTPRRWAMWIAQWAHESGGFTRLVESLDYTPEALMKMWPSRFSADLANRLGRTDRQRANQVAIATVAYGDRMGNRRGTNDGWDFRGRGLPMLTGRENYTAFGLALGLPLAQSPDLVSEPLIGARVAAQYWKSRDLNRHADTADMIRATRAINGGLIGLEDRQRRYDIARHVLRAP